MPANLRSVFMPDPEGKESYPIVTYSWLLLYRHVDDKNKLALLKDVCEMVSWRRPAIQRTARLHRVYTPRDFPCRSGANRNHRSVNLAIAIHSDSDSNENIRPISGYSMKRVVFVCIENSNRSQMAEAFGRIMGGVETYSAGFAPLGPG